MGTDAGSAVNEGVESGADADDARTDADQTESPSPSAEEEKKDEQDSNSCTTSAKATKTSSKCEDLIRFCFGFFFSSILVLLCFVFSLSRFCLHPSSELCVHLRELPF